MTSLAPRIAEFARIVRRAAVEPVEIMCLNTRSARNTRRMLYDVRQALIDSGYDMEAAIMAGAMQLRVEGRRVIVERKGQDLADQMRDALEEPNDRNLPECNRLDNAE